MHLNTWFQGKGDQSGWKPINKKYAIIEAAGAYVQRIAITESGAEIISSWPIEEIIEISLI